VFIPLRHAIGLHSLGLLALAFLGIMTVLPSHIALLICVRPLHMLHTTSLRAFARLGTRLNHTFLTPSGPAAFHAFSFLITSLHCSSVILYGPSWISRSFVCCSIRVIQSCTDWCRGTFASSPTIAFQKLKCSFIGGPVSWDSHSLTRSRASIPSRSTLAHMIFAFVISSCS
jgi:hypothetical protein